MAWEDLERDIAEEFSDTRLGWVDSGYQFIQRSGRRPPGPRWKRTATDSARRRRKSIAQQLGRLKRGERHGRCSAPGCCNLLPIIPRGGGHQRFCSERCGKGSKWVRLKRAQRARRREQAYALGARPTVCGASGCSNLLPPVKTKVSRYCSDRCGARGRRQRKAGTTGASAAGGGTGAQE